SLLPPSMEDHDASSRPSGSGDVIDGNTVTDELRAARLMGNTQKEEESLRFLRTISAPRQVGELAYSKIGNEFDIEFIKERTATVILFSSLCHAIKTGQRVHRFRNLANCNFVELLDSCEPSTPVGLTGITDHTVLRVLRWVYKQNNLPVLKEFEMFLAHQPGMSLFNEYQLLHMANRFDFPHLRIGILSKLQTVEDMDAFRRNENYALQLSVVDKELFELRADVIKRFIEEGKCLHHLFFYDFHNGCSGRSSCENRYVELSEEEKDEMVEIEDDLYQSGFNSEITGIDF
ncbi:hypothetical protein PENTCL1PPCAC_6269, partial [Pristionchus entomophagus]